MPEMTGYHVEALRDEAHHHHQLHHLRGVLNVRRDCQYPPSMALLGMFCRNLGWRRFFVSLARFGRLEAGQKKVFKISAIA
jgi:hypothetical protein